MSYYSPSIEKLIEAFERLPSIGNKTAARLAFYMLDRSEEEVNELFAMAEEAGGTVWQKPQWKDWGGMDGYSGYFLDPDGYPWEVAYAPFLRLSEDNRLLPKTKSEV